jgi:hypothetical protein
MCYRVIFLDIDGVLNCADWLHSQHQTGIKYKSFMERHYKELDPARVKMISDFAVETQASIIISSTWRILHELHELCDMLSAAGMDQSVLPVGVTPRSEKGFRGDEIRAWLHQNPHINNYVIFDDDGDFYSGQPLVKTTWDDGLLPSHIEAARHILVGS